MDDGPFPKLIVFDLDYTLWDFWIDTHVEPPLRQDAVTGVVYDSAIHPMRVGFYEDVPEMLRELKDKPGVSVAVASRTSATKLAQKALRYIRIPVSTSAGRDTTNVSDDNRVQSLPAINFFDDLEIYPGSKVAHFKQLYKITSVPYNEMLFFDDESRNREVEKQLDVTFILVRDGMNWGCFQKGLREWRRRHTGNDSSPT